MTTTNTNILSNMRTWISAALLGAALVGCGGGGGGTTPSHSPTTYTLTVDRTGSGTVTSSPSGISCGSSCSGSYDSGAGVTLTAGPDSGYSFSGWGGACSGVGSTCTVTMTAATTVSTTFTVSTGGGGYDIAAKIAEVNAAMGVTVNLPASPTLTSTCSASNASEFSSCIGTDGRDVTVTSSFSGDFTIGGTDKRITINPGVTISATGNTSLSEARVFNITGTRIHIRGPGTVAGALYTSATAQDVRLDSRLRIVTRTDSTNHNWDRWEMLGTRLLAEGIVVRAKTYAPYSIASTDLVVANCDIEEVGAADATAAQPSFRVVGVTRVVLIDSRIHNPWRHSVRAHSNGSTPSNYVYIARNSIETDADDNLGGGVMSNKSAGNPNPQTTNLWFNENLIYGAGVHINDDGDSIAGHGFVEAIDNTRYTDLAGVGFLFGPAAYAGTRTNNVSFAYQVPNWVQQ